MIYAYGITAQGTYHVKKDIVCQDANEIIKCNDNMVVAAVADGLGSEAHSDVASKIAAKTATTYCKEKITVSSEANEIPNIIKDAFSLAMRAIEKEAYTQKYDIDQCDTTLTLAVLIDDTLYYGHSGDSGIVALTVEGLYERVTEQQRDEDDKVFPLFFEDRWVFGQFSKKVASVFLATDGMYETLFPFLIRNEPVNIHVNLARFFMDNQYLQIEENGEHLVKKKIEKFLDEIPDEQVNDDKIVVVLVNTSIEPKRQTDDYYKEPDWAELKRKRDEEWKRVAYPSLYEKGSSEVEEAAAPSQPVTNDSEESLICEGSEVNNVSTDNDSIEKSEGGLATVDEKID